LLWSDNASAVEGGRGIGSKGREGRGEKTGFGSTLAHGRGEGKEKRKKKEPYPLL